MKSILGILLCFTAGLAFAAGPKGYHVSGNISLDTQWNRVVYLSHIEAFERLHTISAAMIFDMAEVDSEGNFEFDGKYLLPEANLYRLHVCKKGDPVSTIIVGGREHNHLNFAMKPGDSVHLNVEGPVFSGVELQLDPLNDCLMAVNDLVESYKSGGMGTAGSVRIRKEDAAGAIFEAGDQCGEPLGRLFAAYTILQRFDKTGAASSIMQLLEGIDLEGSVYAEEVAYMASFKTGAETATPQAGRLPDGLIGLLMALPVAIVLGWWLVRNQQGNIVAELSPATGISELSVQERKVFAMLSEGATNKEISAALNIGINTVKSHVQRIYRKLNIASRKEAVALKERLDKSSNH